VIIVNDISFWQDAADFEQMAKLSAGVILRAGQGSWQDKRFTKPLVAPGGYFWINKSAVVQLQPGQIWQPYR